MNPYDVDVSNSNIQGPLARLKILYEDMPPTTGCDKCVEVNGADNKDWCCRTTNPSMYYSEFLYVWQEVQKWSKSKRASLVLRCIRNYLSNSLSKGCVMYADGCQCYNERPFTCRMYGVVCPESFEKRYRSLQERQGERFVAKPQCPLVKVDNPEYLSSFVRPEDEDSWFRQIMTIETRIGMSEHLLRLHDMPGGPYRTFHDHILIELFPPSFLEMLTKTRMTNPSPEDIEKTIELLDGVLQETGVIK